MRFTRRALLASAAGLACQGSARAAGRLLSVRPASPGQGFGEFTTRSTGAGAMFGADIYYLDTAPVAQFSQFFDSILLPQFTAAGAQLVARLVTEEAKNDSPLPVREHDRTYVCLTRWSNLEAHGAFVRRYATLHGWRDSATEAILPALMRKPERLRLEPTARSPLR